VPAVGGNVVTAWIEDFHEPMGQARVRLGHYVLPVFQSETGSFARKAITRGFCRLPQSVLDECGVHRLRSYQELSCVQRPWQTRNYGIKRMPKMLPEIPHHIETYSAGSTLNFVVDTMALRIPDSSGAKAQRCETHSLRAQSS
jgi:hypothetical protein